MGSNGGLKSLTSVCYILCDVGDPSGEPRQLSSDSRRAFI